jgi:hypothetical protein
MFYNYKNCQVSLSGINLFASDVQIGSRSSIEPVFISERKFSSSFAPTDNVITDVKISYYLTGKDFVKSFIDNERAVLSGNIGGLYFKSGYLLNYSISAKQNEPVSAEVQVAIFDRISGVFSPSTQTPDGNTKVLNCSDVTVNGFKIGDENNILSAGFSFKNEVKPYYSINSGTGFFNFSPDRVVFGQRSISTSVELDNLSGDLSIYGDKAGLQLHFKDREDGLVKESFKISGTLEARNISIGGEAFTRGTLSIRQESAEGLPTIIDFNPKSGHKREKIEITGTAFNTFPEVYVNGLFASDVNYVSDSLIEVLIPTLFQEGSGQVCLFANDAFICSNDYFTVFSGVIIVSGFLPLSGKIGSKVVVSGGPFNDIDEVYVGDAKATFEKITTSNILSLDVPPGAQWDYISLKSTFSNSFGVSSGKFLPFPEIKAIIPRTASPGTTVIVSGLALSAITGV